MKKGLEIGLAVLAVLALGVGAAWGGSVNTTATGSGDYSQSVYIDHDDPVSPLGDNWGADVRESIDITHSQYFSVNSHVSNWLVVDTAFTTTASSPTAPSIEATAQFNDLVDAGMPGANNNTTISTYAHTWFQANNAGQQGSVANSVGWGAVIPTVKSNTQTVVPVAGGYGSTVRASMSDWGPGGTARASNQVSSGGWTSTLYPTVSGANSMTTFFGAPNVRVLSAIDAVGQGNGYLSFEAKNVPNAAPPSPTQQTAIHTSGNMDGSNITTHQTSTGLGFATTTHDYDHGVAFSSPPANTFLPIFPGAFMNTAGR